MKKNVSAKEELINMLSEIYNQLEELETALDSNFSGIRNALQMDCSDHLSSCTDRMQALETEIAYYQAKSGKADGKESTQRQPSIKLELGYKLH
ncbi:hypothetical protein RRV45_13825 [Bacillus sp. DTU_2020_1000418_1_SI_GHA_SEK_038]|uniref:hypothetical protein n=1 Tax=Bacillus sp. DTU_2020_1000418_1_SI_GHA_SEK_038 TaxID=3077585 RepID=UPI0028EF41AD|nr:hypothetical protein [Bacillus sp. DTU_2020_1000418_1_SI_GHA_SEK_038]WNS73994.1 hypothetical protein RRV45_13825 [Bacillus sp. DTU_2020_1000418_1_SI_GHA_SEK_038]